jgi:DNA-binding PadR family transcriptional regulator
MTRTFKRSPLALTILALLYEEPMHPYRMQRLIKDRGKDQVVNVGQRASLYQTINQLLREELITFWETERAEGFPERTVYTLTAKGRVTAVTWLREMLSTPAQEFPEFPAAISLLPLLTMEDAIHQMSLREARLVEQITVLDQEIERAKDLPRLFLLETEYLRLIYEGELNWVRSIITAIRTGELTWNHDWMRSAPPPDTDNQ